MFYMSSEIIKRAFESLLTVLLLLLSVCIIGIERALINASMLVITLNENEHFNNI
jgi:hypothetical protein